jgi:hypothetical protein
MRELARITPVSFSLEVAMIRSMMIVCALGAFGAVGCVATSDAADETATAQDINSHGGGGALFDCKNVASISVVQCVGTLLNVNALNINVKDVSVLDNDQIKVLDDDLNNLKITDINILNGNNVLSIVKSTVLSDFLNKFNIDVTKNDIDVCALVGICV